MIPSMAVFCPLGKAPTSDYLDELWAYIQSKDILKPFSEAVTGLPDMWTTYARHRPSIAVLQRGPSMVRNLSDWMLSGRSDKLVKESSGIVCLPLLIIIHLGQYFQLLDYLQIKHADFLHHLHNGAGAQGYCGGLPIAVTVTCSKDEKELVRNACKIVRLVLGIGIYSEIGTPELSSGATIAVVHLNHEGQGQEIISRFPHTYISAITDPKTISIVGPASSIAQIMAFAQKEKLLAQEMHISSKLHNPENEELASDLRDLCDQLLDLQLPAITSLQAPLRSNKTGRLLVNVSLDHEIITTILTNKCCWYELMTYASHDLQKTGRNSHVVASLGMGDVIPLIPFHNARLTLIRLDIAKVSNAKVPKYYGPQAVAIVGIGGRFPGATDAQELWPILEQGITRHEEVPQHRINIMGSFRASQDERWTSKKRFFGNFLDNVDHFDHSFFGISAKEAASMDPQQRVLLETAFEAMDSSGYLKTHDRKRGDNVGVFIGASFVEYSDNTSSHAPTAYTSTGTIRAFLCGRLSYFFGWTGPSEVIDTACSSSLVAVNRGYKALFAHDYSLALVGGINLICSAQNFLDLAKAGFLSPTGQCKPFDAAADGYCRAEGVGLLVMKRLDDALKNSDHILGVIPGAGTNQSGLSSSLTVPYSPAQVDLYKTILQQSGITAQQVSYIETHGTGTQAGDPIEIGGIREVFGSSSRETPLYLGSVKGNVGHLETAAGVTGLIKVIWMLAKGYIPPVASFKSLNSKIPPLEVDNLAIPTSLQVWNSSFKIACVNSYGAAGSNSAVLVCESPKPSAIIKDEADGDSRSYPVLLSALSVESLISNSNKLRAYLETGGQDVAVRNVAFTLSERRQQFPVRWVGVAGDLQELLHKLPKTNQDIVESNRRSKKTVLVFSGQSKANPDICRGLYDSCLLFKHYFDQCNKTIQALGFPSIIPLAFQQGPISDIIVLHCSIFAGQYSCAKSWLHSGLHVSALIGHSFGELTALAVSDVLSLEDALLLVATRASLIMEKWGTPKGTMLYIQADFQQVQDLISTATLDSTQVEVACLNSPRDQVIVGEEHMILHIRNHLRTLDQYRDIRHKILDITHGYHSRFASNILEDLSQLANTLTFRPPKIHIETCTQAPVKSFGSDHIRRHTREPVYFYQAVQRIEQQLESCIWLEAGMDTSVIEMVRKAVKTTSTHIFQSLKIENSGNSLHSLSLATTKLWQLGLSVSFWNFTGGVFADLGISQVWLPPYQFTKTPCWLPYVDHAAVTLRDRLAKQEPIETHEISKETPLVRPCAGTDGLFIIQTDSQRFQSVVRSHAVLRQPLCPAAMYLECVIMAVIEQTAGTIIQAFRFSDVKFGAALGMDPDRHVSLQLKQKEDSKPQLFSFTVNSELQGRKEAETTLHSQGTLTLDFTLNPDLTERLIRDNVKRVTENSNAQRFDSVWGYRLFSRVVHYADLLKGIKSIIILENQAVAEVHLPTAAEAKRNFKIFSYDAILLDIFIQVLGLLINTSDLCPDGDVFVTTFIERISISVELISAENAWTVYATFYFSNESKALGDIYVMNQQGRLVGTVLGIQFSRVTIEKLEKTLKFANPYVGEKTTILDNDAKMKLSCSQNSSIEKENYQQEQSYVHTRNSLQEPPTKNKRDNIEHRLMEVLSAFTDYQVENLRNDQTLEDLGLDSLATVELNSELSAIFDRSIQLDSLQRTIGELRHDFLGATEQFFAHDINHFTLSGLGDQNTDPTKVQDLPVKGEILKLISETSGLPDAKISESATLQNLGIDSLALTELKSEIENASTGVIGGHEINLDTTIAELLQKLGAQNQKPNIIDSQANGDVAEKLEAGSTPSSSDSPAFSILEDIDSLEVLKCYTRTFNENAQRHGFKDYWSSIAPEQERLVLAYIAEAFRDLGVDLWTFPPKTPIPQINILPKYSKLVRRYWQILQSLEVVTKEGSLHLRTEREISRSSSTSISAELHETFPEYRMEHQLLAVTGTNIAKYLTGKADPVQTLFANPQSQSLLNDFYHNSPMLATATDQLLSYMEELIENLPKGGTIRCLEVGGGFGATTDRMLQLLTCKGVIFEYTFTDIAPSLVKKACSKHSSEKRMKFDVIDLERNLPVSCAGAFDIVLATNVIHATADLVETISKIKTALKQGGILVMSEVTTVIDWYDLCFGLLDGWWLAKDGRDYPLQPGKLWTQALEEAGFSSTISESSNRESASQQLIVGSTKRTSLPPSLDNRDNYIIEEVTYKFVDDTPIMADIFIPKGAPSAKSSPVAMMFHGGGYLTLSKKAVRPAQIAFLIANGVLPISFDYRLCPEVDLLSGAMTDARDALLWSRTKLPEIMHSHGIKVDTDTIIAMGWSSGGHLAMTTAWTATEAGIRPPSAVLNLYGPTDLSPDLYRGKSQKIPSRTMSWSCIQKSVAKKAITQYCNEKFDSTGLGWLHPGDPRSEALFSFHHEGTGLKILLDGIQPLVDQEQRIRNDHHQNDFLDTCPLDSKRVASITPITQAQSGHYKTPTFIIHGQEDSIVPVDSSIQFQELLEKQGVKSGITVVPNAEHIFDLCLRPGTVDRDRGLKPGFDFVLDLIESR